MKEFQYWKEFHKMVVRTNVIETWKKTKRVYTRGDYRQMSKRTVANGLWRIEYEAELDLRKHQMLGTNGTFSEKIKCPWCECFILLSAKKMRKSQENDFHWIVLRGTPGMDVNPVQYTNKCHRTNATGQMSQDKCHRTNLTGQMSQDKCHRTNATGQCAYRAIYCVEVCSLLTVRDLYLYSRIA